jgi:hypothetical protein
MHFLPFGVLMTSVFSVMQLTVHSEGYYKRALVELHGSRARHNHPFLGLEMWVGDFS